MTAYKGFDINTSASPKPWGPREEIYVMASIDSMVGDSINPLSADPTGHKHARMYDNYGHVVINTSANTVNIPSLSTGFLALDTNHNLVISAGNTSTVSGTSGYIPYFTGVSTVNNSPSLYITGNNIVGKLSGTSHGVTDILPTDSPWGIITSNTSASNGTIGTRLIGIASPGNVDNAVAISIEGICGQDDGGEVGTTGQACIVLEGSLINGTNRKSVDNGYNLVTIQNNGVNEINFKAEGIVDANTGFQIGGIATSGNYLRGNGTNFVSGPISASDIPNLSATYLLNNSLINWTTSAQVSGFTGTLSINNVYYVKYGKTVQLWYNFQGTSNLSTFTFTLPFAADVSIITEYNFAAWVKDNSSVQSTPGNAKFPFPTNLVYIFKDFNGTSWTASGLKGADGYICYQATT